jgi:hypothetical protein
MRRRNMLAVLSLGPAVMLAQVRPDYPKTPGEVIVGGKPKPIVAFWSGIAGSVLHYAATLDDYPGYGKFQRLPLFDIKIVSRIEFFPFSESDISTLKGRQNDLCKDPAEVCELRRGTVIFRGGRKSLQNVYILLGLGNTKVYGPEGEEYSLTDRDITAASFK